MSKYKTDYSEFDEDEYIYDESTPIEDEDGWGFIEEIEEDDAELIEIPDNEEIENETTEEDHYDEIETDDEDYPELDLENETGFEFEEIEDDEYEDDEENDEYNDEEEEFFLEISDDEEEETPLSVENPEENNVDNSTSDHNDDNSNKENTDPNEQKEITSFKDIGNSLLSNLKETKESIDLDKFFNHYDSAIAKMASFVAKIPILGGIVKLFQGNKAIFRLFPFIIALIIVSVLVSVSFITAPSKTSTILLPDMGETTVESGEYNPKDSTISLKLTNTGGVILPTNGELTLYSYNPSINPLSLTKFETVGTCQINEVIVDLDETLELNAPCEIIEGAEINYRVTAEHQDTEE